MADPQDKQAAKDELLGMLGENGWSDSIMAKRGAKTTPTAPAEPLSPAAQIDAASRGDSAERASIATMQFNGDQRPGVYPPEPSGWADAFATRNSQALPGFDGRMQQLRTEVPQVATKSPGMLASLWGKATDIAGKPLGFALNLLDLPAEGIERGVGMMLFNELPLAERWEAAHYAYDTLYADMFHPTRGGSHALEQAIMLGQTSSELDKRFGNETASMVGHFLADPMWLVGGVPFIEAATKGTRFAGVGGAVGRGLDFSKIPLLRDIPVVGKLGKPVADQMLERSLSMFDATGDAVDLSAGRTSGGWRQLFQLTPRAHVDEDYSHATAILGSFRDGAHWGDTWGATSPVRQAFLDASGGQISDMFGLAGTESGKKIAALLQDSPDIRQTVAGMESLKNNFTNGFWDDAKHILTVTRDGQQTDMLRVMTGGGKLTAEENQVYGAYRSMKAMNEFAERGIPALYDYHRLPNNGVMENIEKFSSGMKLALSMAVINSPSFVLSNYANNGAFGLALKAEDLSGALSFFRNPMKFSKQERAVFDSYGMSEGMLKSLSGDTAFQSEFLPGIIDSTKDKGRMRSRVQKSMWLVEQASKIDEGARGRAFTRGLRDAYHAVWKVGDGGVLDDIPEVLKGTPYEDWRNGLAFRGPAEIDKMLNAASTDELVTGSSLVQDWVKHSGYIRDASDPGEAARVMAGQVPDAFVDEIDNMTDAVRTARRAGQSDFLAGVTHDIDNMHDELSFNTYQDAMRDGLERPDLASTSIRQRTVPWQQHAMFLEEQAQRSEMLARIAATDASAHSGPTLLLAQQAMQDYRDGVSELMRGHAGMMLNEEAVTRFAGRQMQMLEERNNAIREIFQHSSRDTRETLHGLLQSEREMTQQGLVSRGIAAGTKTAAEWDTAVRESFTAAKDALDKTWADSGLERAVQHSTGETPTHAGRMGVTNGYLHELLDHVADVMPSKFHESVPVSEEMAAAMRADGEHLNTAMTQRNYVGNIHGQAVRDWAMLNYSRKYGIDSVVQLVFPYHFWMSRTAADYMKMTMARPGVSAATVRLYDGIKQINEDANVPDRVKNGIRIPIPFIGDKLMGKSSLYFDPLKLLFPLANFTDDTEYSNQNATWLGHMHDYASKLPAGMINPFMTLGLGASGALGDRDAYVRRSFASVRGLPYGIPGPRVIRAISDWVSGVAEDPDPQVLTPELKQRIASGEGMHDGELKEALKYVWSVASSDGWDGYRSDRMVASLVGEDPQRWTPRDGMEALKYHAGPLWTEAVRRSKTDEASTILTGWALMPVRAYPQGEAVQRGLDALYGEIKDDGPKAVDAFFKQHPEYQVRKIALADRNDPAGQSREVDTTLYYLDVGKVSDKYDPTNDKLRTTLQQAEKAKYLETKDGRRMVSTIQNDINIISQQRQQEMDDLKALYPHRKTEISTRAAPHEQAMFNLREQYFAIDRRKFKTADEYNAARDAFMQQLPSDAAPNGVWMQAAVKGVATWNDFSAQIAQHPENTKALITERDAKLRAMGTSAQGSISRAEFQNYVNGSKTAPTANHVEYTAASGQLQEYFAIAESGVAATTAKTMQRSWWAAHPLLEKYYGNDEPKPWSAASAATYGRMDQIWKGYYALDGNARGQKDYLGMKLEELNNYRRSTGLQPLKLVDPMANKGAMR